MADRFYSLKQLGWSPFFEKEFEKYQEEGYIAARIAVEHKNRYAIVTIHGERSAVPSGSLRYRASWAEMPAVGDWVAVYMNPEERDAEAVIHALLPRKSKFSRNVSGRASSEGLAVETGEQIVAANVDTLFLVSSLNREFNVKRIERYMTMAWDSGASPVIILNKADLCSDPEGLRAETEAIAWGAPVHVVSALEGSGVEELRTYFREGESIALLGSSGVGKSSLINAILGREVMYVGEIADYKDRGRHTTTHRQMILLGEQGVVIDTPGMRELQLWGGTEGVDRAFADIEQFAAACRFSNCRHEGEPGCGVAQAIEDGTLTPERYQGYLKLRREAEFHERKQRKAERRSIPKQKYDRRARGGKDWG